MTGPGGRRSCNRCPPPTNQDSVLTVNKAKIKKETNFCVLSICRSRGVRPVVEGATARMMHCCLSYSVQLRRLLADLRSWENGLPTLRPAVPLES